MKIKNKAVTAAKINPSGLTVPNATHATSADSATNATNATNATTSSRLGGVAASHYLTKSATLTIPGVAFQPEGSGATQACIPETGSAGSGNILYAPVELPTGSTITKMTYYWWDDNGGDATATLNRIALPATDPKQVMATASSSGSAAVHNFVLYDVDHERHDRQLGVHVLRQDCLPRQRVRGCRADHVHRLTIAVD